MIRDIDHTETGEYFCFVRNTAGEDGGGLDLHVRYKIVGKRSSGYSSVGRCLQRQQF